MSTAYIYKVMLVIGLLLGQVMTLWAQQKSNTALQDSNFARAERIYKFVVAGQGDSIYTELAKDLQGKLSPLVFNDTFRQLERQVGKFQSKGEWKTQTAEGITIYYSDVKFEHYILRFLLAFNEDGKMNTIRFVPAPAPSTAKPVTYDKEKMEERDITVGADGFKLPGTLTLPKKAVSAKVKVPVVILVHGSGPNDRDETIGPNKPFRDLAWGLAERGIAVIRYDKRTKVYGAACVPEGREIDYDVETVDDAVEAVAFAKTLPEIASDSVYVLGHSLGAILAPRIAERADGLAGIVVLAGSARPLEDVVVEQVTYIASLQDSSVKAKEQVAEIKRQAENTKKLGTAEFDDKIPVLLSMPQSYWKFAHTYKPVEVAAKLKLPILILQGERDYQVTMEDFGLWRFGLLRCKNVSFKSYPKLNHLLQEGTGKSAPFEYEEASPVPGYVMDDVASFVRKKELR